MRFWIVVASKDHISRGIAGGFVQANHGKAGSLKRMAAGDWLICYSPKQTFTGDELCQAFTAIGQIADENLYQHKMSDTFNPYRRNINYYECNDAPIAPLIEYLDFIPNKKSWGYPFRFGFLEINEHDFNLIKSKMIA